MSIHYSDPVSWISKLFFKSTALNKQLIRCMDLANGYGATVTECLATANEVEAEDEVSWYKAWNSTAEKVFGVAEKALETGHKISARQAYFRASMYFRAASFYMLAPENLERGLKAGLMMKESFHKAIQFSTYRIDPVDVPFENTSLPCYFYSTPESDSKKAPVVVISGGIDDTAEELHFKIASAAVSRGYNVLVLQGPGQGQTLREQNLGLRFNWETVITPVVDYLLTRDEIDPDKIIVYGNSFSGGLVARAAAFEHRPKVYILNSGLYSFADWLLGTLSPQLFDLLESSPKNFDQAMFQSPVDTIDQRIRSVEMSFRMGMYKPKPSELFTAMKKFTTKDVVENITSHMLIIDAEDEIFPGQAKQLFDKLNSPKTWMYFSRDEMASLHCQSGNRELSNQKIFDWLDEFFKK